MQLAETYYTQPGLAQKILGPPINPAQIFGEPSVEARLQSGELDAASAYKIQPGPFHLPYIRLPQEINLGDEALHEQYEKTSIVLNGKTYRPESLVYYAAVLDGSKQKQKAQAFVAWLTSGALPILQQFAYDPPAGTAPLHA